jgi:hypothetical protein
MNHPTSSPDPTYRSPLSQRLVRCLGATALAAAAWLGVGATALAANANFTVTVAPINADVSVGRSGLTTYDAFRVTLTNMSGNTTNAIVFGGSTNVTGDLTATGGDANAVASYVESDPLGTCSGSGTTVQCNIGQMKNGVTKSFVVIFAAPALADADHWATDAKIDFNWSFDYSSGNSSGTPTSLICNSQPASPPPCTGTNSTNLITTATDAILSSFVTYIPSFGGTFFTGNGASALPSNPGLTNPLLPTALLKLKVPGAEKLSTAQVQQNVVAGGLTSATTTTITSIIKVPNNDQPFSQFITIFLQRDASTHANGAKIADAVVLYSHTDDLSNLNPVPPCPANGDPSGFTPPVCEMLSLRTEFTKKTAPTPDDVGDWLFVIHALENGGFKF